MNLVKWIKRGELLCRGYFHDTGMTFIRNESCPYYFLFTRYWTTFHSCTSNSRMSSFQFSMTIFKWNYCSGAETGNSSSWVRIVVKQKYYKGSYGDLSDHYLGVKNSNKDTSEFLTCVCLNLWCFVSIFGCFRAIPVLLLFVFYDSDCRAWISACQSNDSLPSGTVVLHIWWQSSSS